MESVQQVSWRRRYPLQELERVSMLASSKENSREWFVHRLRLVHDECTKRMVHLMESSYHGSMKYLLKNVLYFNYHYKILFSSSLEVAISYLKAYLICVACIVTISLYSDIKITIICIGIGFAIIKGFQGCQVHSITFNQICKLV